MTFQLDTSGTVRVLANDWPGAPRTIRYFTWTDLPAFTQGYVEALLRELSERLDRIFTQQRLRSSDFGRFDRLAPATVARIMADCETALARSITGIAAGSREMGRRYWANATLTPYLGDEGLIYLREAGQ